MWERSGQPKVTLKCESEEEMLTLLAKVHLKLRNIVYCRTFFVSSCFLPFKILVPLKTFIALQNYTALLIVFRVLRSLCFLDPRIRSDSDLDTSRHFAR